MLIHLVHASSSESLLWRLETEILLLPTNKSHGLYSCPVRVLKSSSSVLSLPLAHIMNNSVLTGQYPSKLKHAKVIPIFKGGDEMDPSNFRPTSLLSLFNWLLEKVMCNRLKSCVELRWPNTLLARAFADAN